MYPPSPTANITPRRRSTRVVKSAKPYPLCFLLSLPFFFFSFFSSLYLFLSPSLSFPSLYLSLVFFLPFTFSFSIFLLSPCFDPYSFPQITEREKSKEKEKEKDRKSETNSTKRDNKSVSGSGSKRARKRLAAANEMYFSSLIINFPLFFYPIFSPLLSLLSTLFSFSFCTPPVLTKMQTVTCLNQSRC